MTKKTLHIVILAAGKGSRMRSKTPKVLHKVAGKPLLGHVVDTALTLDPATIHIVIGHGKEQVLTEFSQHPQRATLNFVEQATQLGTGDAVSHALPGIPDDAIVLMLTADVPLIKSATLKALVDCMQSNTLTVLTAELDNPFGLGRITRDQNGCVDGIVEEKDANETQRKIKEINSGIICAHKNPLTQWLKHVGNKNKQQEYYLTDVVGIAYHDGNPISTLKVEHSDEVSGINDRLQLAKAERAYQAQQTEALMRSGVTLVDPKRVDIRGTVNIGEDTIIDINVLIEGTTSIGNDVTIGPNCVISNCTVADNVTIHANSVLQEATVSSQCQIGPFARLRPGSHLAEGVKIGNFVETKNAKLETGAKVNHLSYVGDAEVGSNTNIGAGVITCNYDGVNKHQTHIGKDVFIGSDCQLVAPVTINDGATIGAGSTITGDVASEALAISRGKQRIIKGWQRPNKIKK